MATQLDISNRALRHLKERRIASLTENREPARVLADEWDDCLRWCLEQGPWTFAIRSIAIRPALKPVPTFGYPAAYKKPDDWLKSISIASDPDFRNAVKRYVDEGGYWYADAGTMFVRYISTAPEFGYNLDRFSPSFEALLALKLAEEACGRITGSDERLKVIVPLRKDAMKALRANDAMNTPPVFPPVGSWVRSRVQNRRGPFGDGGYGDGLVGGSDGLIPTADTSLGVDSDVPINTDFIPRT